MGHALGKLGLFVGTKRQGVFVAFPRRAPIVTSTAYMLCRKRQQWPERFDAIWRGVALPPAWLKHANMAGINRRLFDVTGGSRGMSGQYRKQGR